jgi:hypothetical protein
MSACLHLRLWRKAIASACLGSREARCDCLSGRTARPGCYHAGRLISVPQRSKLSSDHLDTRCPRSARPGVPLRRFTAARIINLGELGLLPLARRTHRQGPIEEFSHFDTDCAESRLEPPGRSSASQVRASKFDYYDFTPARSSPDLRLSPAASDCFQRLGPSRRPPGHHQHFVDTRRPWAFKTARTQSRAIGEQQHQDDSTPPFIYQISVGRSHPLQPQRRPQRSAHLPEITQNAQFQRRHLLWRGRLAASGYDAEVSSNLILCARRRCSPGSARARQCPAQSW